MRKLYIDVTESYAWRGKATGIIRVIDEISSRFANDKRTNPTFVTWDERTVSFREVDLTKLLLKRSNDQKSGSQAGQAIIEEYGIPIYTAGIRIPFSRTVRRLAKYSKRVVLKPSAHKNRVNFGADALLFMPHGGVWGSSKYAAKVFELQKTKGIKLAPILYDLCPVMSPQFCSKGIRRAFNRYMRKVLVKADLVLAISKNTAQDAQAWIKLINAGQASPIQVFRLGDEIGKNGGTKPKHINLPDKFIICVGTVEARKNHAGLYYAYKLAQQKGVDLPNVVIVGRKGWLTKDIYEIITIDPDVKDKFIFMHDVSDNELAWLYENAQFSVYPSFYEGWGLPVAESLLHGTPCIASNTSSIPEIAGVLVDYFSPYFPGEIMEKIHALNSSPKLLKQKRKKIKAGYKATSWDDSYKQVFAAFKKL